MGLLNAGNLKKAFGTDVVFSGVSFEIQENDRIGLVGRNGCGKTTLLRILTGELSPDEGTVGRASDARLGYMEQQACRDPERTAYDEVLTVFRTLSELEKEIEQVNRSLQDKPGNADALIERQAELNDRFLSGGGLTYRSRARSALIGLGFSEEQLGQKVGVLSGGQRAKLQLAKLLLGGASLLLLDEPTNHLDISSVRWLEDFLRSWSGAFVVTSHDRYFLDRITGRTFEMENGRLQVYKGNYTAYLAQKGENDLAARRKYDNTQKEIARIEGIVEQQRRWNRERNIRTAESKLKSIERLKSTLEKPEEEEDSIRFRFGTERRSGNDVLSVKDLALSFDGREIFRNVDMEIHRGERIFLIGPNGCGKTSLLKALLGINAPAEGSVRFGEGVDTGYYDQLQTGLRPEKEVIDEIWDYYPRMNETEVRSALALFLFRGEDVFKPVSALSGGERARILLLRLMLSRDNFLLLDEPTNHLDIRSCEALESALRDYDGTLLAVSHDRYLINKFADRIYYLGPDGATPYSGNYDDFLAATETARAEEPKASAGGEEYRVRKEREAAVRKEKAEMRRLEERIGQTEQELEELSEKLSEPETASDYQAAMELTEKIAGLKRENDAAFSRWSELAQKYGD
jgi:ATP-binding cassette subfamily F protein 3